MVKNPFGLFSDLLLFADVYLQVSLTRLTLVDKTWLFLKLLIFNKNRLVAYHSYKTKKVILGMEKMQECE